MNKIIFLLFVLLVYAVGILTGFMYKNAKADTLYIGKTAGVHLPTLVTLPTQVGYVSQYGTIGVTYGTRSIDKIDDGNFTLREARYTNKGVFYRRDLNFWNLRSMVTINQYVLYLAADARVDDDHNSSKTYGERVTGSLDASVTTGCLGAGWDYQWWIARIGIDIYAHCGTVMSSIDATDSDLQDVGDFVNKPYARYLMLYLGVQF